MRLPPHFQEGREELYKHMNRIREEGDTVIFISHDLPEILRLSDTITVLRDGVYIDTVKSADIDEEGLKKLMVGREISGKYYRSDYGEKVSDEVVLKVENVTVPGLTERRSMIFQQRYHTVSHIHPRIVIMNRSL